VPDLGGFAENNVFVDSATLVVQKPSSQLVVRYTTDGSVPGRRSPELPPTLVIREPVTIKLAAFAGNGNRGDINTLVYRHETYSSPAAITGQLKNGLQCLYYPGSFDSTKKMLTETTAQTYSTESVVVPASIHAPSFGLQYRGYLDIPETGVYGFFLTSDDGSLLRIDRKIVVNNDGLHGAQERSGEMAMTKGLHIFALDFIEGGGGYTLRLKYARQGGIPQDLPFSMFKQPAP
jgi:hexosaminidase